MVNVAVPALPSKTMTSAVIKEVRTATPQVPVNTTASRTPSRKVSEDETESRP